MFCVDNIVELFVRDDKTCTSFIWEERVVLLEHEKHVFVALRRGEEVLVTSPSHLEPSMIGYGSKV